MCQKDWQIETCNMPPEFSASFSSGCYSYPILSAAETCQVFKTWQV
jgi:hypothetical protein